nr:b3 domain-containing protein [Quercus suber]
MDWNHQLIGNDIEQVGSKKPRTSISNKPKKAIIDHLYKRDDVKSSAMELAEEVQAYLAADTPSFVKFMLPSHVTRGFWLGLPRDFCKDYMPCHDSIITLVDERGREFEVIYLEARKGLSGGWRSFSIAHRLCERDVLVFQLVLPFKLKVYIVREICLTEVDGAVGLMKLARVRGPNFVTAAEKHSKPSPIEKNSRKIKQRKAGPTDSKMSLSLSLTHEKRLDSEGGSGTEQVFSVVPCNPRSFKENGAMVEVLYDRMEAKSSALKQAMEVQASLPVESPSFIKTLVRSNVTGGYWLRLPAQFCKMHLPRHDIIVILEDESREEYKTKYIAENAALSSGWRRFSIAHKLCQDDVLVFQLIGTFKFKVYTVRLNGLAGVDGLFGPSNLDACARGNDYGSIANFKEVNSISGFTILVNGETIDSQFSDYQRVKYYDLCCSQNSFLHDNLRKNINSKLAAEIISETINIVDAIRACELLTPVADFEDWDNTLKGFELLGMNVQFLHARVARLMSIAMEAAAVKDPQRKSKVRLEQAHAEEVMDFLKLKLSKLKKTKERLDDEIEALKVNVVRHEIVFQEVVNAPW